MPFEVKSKVMLETEARISAMQNTLIYKVTADSVTRSGETSSASTTPFYNYNSLPGRVLIGMKYNGVYYPLGFAMTTRIAFDLDNRRFYMHGASIATGKSSMDFSAEFFYC